MDKNKLKNFLAAETIFVLCFCSLIFAIVEKSAFYLIVFGGLLEDFAKKIKHYKNNDKLLLSLPFYIITSIFLNVVVFAGLICKFF
ncbi:MAG: hypothetical protein IJC97_02215 [Oscillospiraceae bacterium]|nr:hypothetical protein [Oscillospiraceae bacterium]